MTYNNYRKSEYLSLLVKKFIFYVHPDYFHNNKRLQVINEANLKLLNALNDGLKRSTLDQEASLPRSLTFYLKSVELAGQALPPRKISLSLQTLEDSLLEVFDTLGVTVIEKVQSDDIQRKEIYGHCISASPRQLISFLESLTDRRSLIAWRQDQKAVLNHFANNLIAITGISGIEFRNSWSAQNNTILLSSILHLIETSKCQLTLPWSGLKLVISTDETNFSLIYGSVDYIERKIYINPTCTPSQWIRTLSRIRSLNDDELIEDNSYLERKISEYLQNQIAHIIANNNDTVQVNISRGFTCSEGSYGLFLSNLAEQLSVNPLICLSELPSTQLRKEPYLLQVIIEDSHGTKILPDGTIRLDRKVNLSNIEEAILKPHLILEALKLSRETQKLKGQVHTLLENMVEKLKVKSLKYGVGIDEGKMKVCLTAMKEYMDRRKGSCGSLKELNGMNLVIGHYLGIADDGSCILPWDLELP